MYEPFHLQALPKQPRMIISKPRLRKEISSRTVTVDSVTDPHMFSECKTPVYSSRVDRTWITNATEPPRKARRYPCQVTSRTTSAHCAVQTMRGYWQLCHSLTESSETCFDPYGSQLFSVVLASSSCGPLLQRSVWEPTAFQRVCDVVASKITSALDAGI
jgi:hypothetical protein